MCCSYCLLNAAVFTLLTWLHKLRAGRELSRLHNYRGSVAGVVSTGIGLPSFLSVWPSIASCFSSRQSLERIVTLSMVLASNGSYAVAPLSKRYCDARTQYGFVGLETMLRSNSEGDSVTRWNVCALLSQQSFWKALLGETELGSATQEGCQAGRCEARNGIAVVLSWGMATRGKYEGNAVRHLCCFHLALRHLIWASKSALGLCSQVLTNCQHPHCRILMGRVVIVVVWAAGTSCKGARDFRLGGICSSDCWTRGNWLWKKSLWGSFFTLFSHSHSLPFLMLLSMSLFKPLHCLRRNITWSELLTCAFLY